MKLIDTDTIKLQEGFFEKVDNVPKFYDWLNSLPTIDAVPVVRCKDCINRPYKIDKDKEANGFNLNAREKDFFEYYCPFMCEDGWYSIMPPDDFYCKNGERRTDETD